MIEGLHLNRFRGIESGLIDRLAPLTVLVGPNNCGKTSILEALYLATTATNAAQLTVRDGDSEQQFRSLLPGLDLSGYQAFRRVLQYHNLDRPSVAEERWDQGVLRINLGGHAQPLRALDVWPHSPMPESDRTIVGMLAVDITKDGIRPDLNLRNLFATAMNAATQAELPRYQRLAIGWVPDLAYNYQAPASWATKGRLPESHLTAYCNAISLSERWGWPFYRTMLTRIPGWSSDVPRAFAQVFSIEKSLQIQFIESESSHFPQVVVTPAGGVGLSLDSFGDGARAAFKLLSSLEALKGGATTESHGLLLWEEPELFQHPRTLARLLAYLAQSLRDRGIQAILSTHSLEVIGHLTELLISQEIAAEDFLLLRLELKDGKLRTSPFRKENLVAWLEDGLDPRLWGDRHAPVRYQLRAGQQP